MASRMIPVTAINPEGEDSELPQTHPVYINAYLIESVASNPQTGGTIINFTADPENISVVEDVHQVLRLIDGATNA